MPSNGKPKSTKIESDGDEQKNRIATWAVVATFVGILVTALLTLLTFLQAGDFHTKELEKAKEFHDQELKQALEFHQAEEKIAEQQLALSEQQPVNQFAKLVATTIFLCDPESIYVTEQISVTNVGFKSASKVRISITDPSTAIYNVSGWCTSPYTPYTPGVTLLPDIHDRTTTVIELPEQKELDPGQSCILQFQFPRDGTWDKGKFDEKYGSQQPLAVSSASGDSRTVPVIYNRSDIQGLSSTLVCAPAGRPIQSFGPLLGTHTVKQGEGLQCIGRAYRVEPYAIAAQNSVPSPYVVYPGQVLIIPPVPWYKISNGEACAPQFAPPVGWPPSPPTS